MDGHKKRILRYQIQNILNNMDADAYNTGVYIKNGEDFAKLLLDMLSLIDESMKGEEE